jgi:hypothetical protein
MLPLEVIGALGLLYVISMVGTVKALRAKATFRCETGVKPFVKDLTPRTARPTA